MLRLIALLREVDHATSANSGRLNRDVFACQNLRNCVCSKVVVGFIALTLISLAVIQRAIIHDFKALRRIEHINLRCTVIAHGLANQLGHVIKDRHIDAIKLSVSCDLVTIILNIGIDHVELNALIRELVAQRFIIGNGIAHDRAANAVRHDHDRRRIRMVEQLMAVTIMVDQAEVIDIFRRAADRCRSRRHNHAIMA